MLSASLELTKLTDIRPRDPRQFASFNYDACGDLLLTGKGDADTVFVERVGHDSAPIKIHLPECRFPIVQRFKDGRWLVTDSRCRDHQKNAHLFSADLEPLDRFCLDDAISHIVIDASDNIWVGYFDENPLGLRKFTRDGQLVFDFNASSGHDIFDLYAMHLDQRGDLWVYPYTGFFLARVSQKATQLVLGQSPVDGAHAILTGGHHVAFFGSYDTNTVFVFDLRANTGTHVQLMAQGTPVERAAIATQGEQAAVLWKDAVYTLHLSQLIAAATGVI